MDLYWLGHAGFKIVSSGKTVYIDPYKTTTDDADLILITHDHYDHYDEASLAEGKKVVGPAGVIAKHGGELINAGECRDIDGIHIEAVEAYNETKSFHPKGQGIGFILELEGKRIYHAGDTDVILEMNVIECDIALLPVSGTYTMDAKEAASAAIILQPEIVIPMHYGAIVGDERDAELFRKKLIEETDIDARILKKDEKVTL